MTQEALEIIYNHRAVWGTPPHSAQIVKRTVSADRSTIRLSEHGPRVPVIMGGAQPTTNRGAALATKLDAATKLQLRLARVKLQLLSC